MNVPKIRFYDFKEEYKTIKLSSIATKISNKNKNNMVKNVISNSAVYGLISQRNFFDKDIANNDNTENYYIIENGNFVYNPRKSNEAPYGPINLYKYEEKGVISPLYLCFKTHNINNYFLEYYFKSPFWHRYIYLNGDSGARHDRVSIKDETFFNMNICIPYEDEQEKIANFLSLVDKKIELQSRKIEDLKLYNNKLLEETINSTECVETTVDDIADIYLGLTYTPQYVESGVPFLSVKDISSGVINNDEIKYISQKEFLNSTSNAKPKRGDILFGRVGTLGCPIIIDDDIDRCIFVSLGFLRLKNNELSAGLIKYWMLSNDFKNQVNKKIAGSSQKNLNTGWLKKFTIKYPKDYDKQITYLNLANKLEEKLKFEDLKLKKLKDLKEGLMQSMFV